MTTPHTMEFRATFNEGGYYVIPVWAATINEGFQTAMISTTLFIDTVKRAGGGDLELARLEFWRITDFGAKAT